MRFFKASLLVTLQTSTMAVVCTVGNGVWGQMRPCICDAICTAQLPLTQNLINQP